MSLKIKELHQYPVAGIGGHRTSEMVFRPEGIEGDRIFTLVSVQQLQKWVENPEGGFPKRLTQTEQPKLALFSAQPHRGRLQLHFEQESLATQLPVDKAQKKLPLCTPFSLAQRKLPFVELAPRFAWPLRVSSSSQTIRWAVDCGDTVAEWVSSRLGEEVRLMQVAAESSVPKQHFTWYSAAHLISLASVAALGEEIGTLLDPALFRANIIIEGEQPFAEKHWRHLMLNAFLVEVQACERCAYMSVDLTTGMRTKPEVHRQIVRGHHGMFGVYLQLPSVRAILREGGSLGLARE